MGKKILVSEDDSFYAKILTTKLQMDGYEVQVVENGERLLEIAQNNKPDLFVIDLLTPVMDGFETLEKINQNENLRDVPKVVLSNLSQEEDKRRTRELGAVEHIVKTELSIHELVDRIKVYLA